MPPYSPRSVSPLVGTIRRPYQRQPSWVARMARAEEVSTLILVATGGIHRARRKSVCGLPEYRQSARRMHQNQ